MLKHRVYRIAISCLLTLCACTNAGPQPEAENAVQQIMISAGSTNAAEVERANRCLGLVQALQPLKRIIDQEVLTINGLDAVDPSVQGALLKQAERIEANSGLPRATLKAIQQRNHVTISDEAEFERLAPEIRGCVSSFMPDPAETLNKSSVG